MQHLLPTHPCMPQTKRQTLKYTLILACRSASFQSSKLFYYRKSPTRDHTESPCKPCANNHTLTARQAAEQGRACGLRVERPALPKAWPALGFPCVILSPPILLPATQHLPVGFLYILLCSGAAHRAVHGGSSLESSPESPHSSAPMWEHQKPPQVSTQSPTSVSAWPNQIFPRK